MSRRKIIAWSPPDASTGNQPVSSPGGQVIITVVNQRVKKPIRKSQKKIVQSSVTIGGKTTTITVPFVKKQSEGKLRRHVRPPAHTHPHDIFYVGNMFTLNTDMVFEKLPAHIAPSKFQFAIPFRCLPDTYSSPNAHKGDVIIYAGEQHIAEMSYCKASIPSVLNVVRHTFIIGSGRYIIADLNLISPLVDDEPQQEDSEQQDEC